MADVAVDDTEIHIAHELPLDVATSLINACSVLWPNGSIDTTRGHGLHLRIPHDDRCRSTRVARKIRAAKTYLEDETEATVRGFDPDGSLRGRAPEHLARILGAAARATFEDTAGAVNFVEMPVEDTRTGNRYVITVAKGADRTPAAPEGSPGPHRRTRGTSRRAGRHRRARMTWAHCPPVNARPGTHR